MAEREKINPSIEQIKDLKAKAEGEINLILSALQWDTLCSIKSVNFISEDGYGAQRIIHDVKIDLFV